MAAIDRTCSVCEKYIEHDDRIRKPFSDIGVCFTCSRVTKFKPIIVINKQVERKIKRAKKFRCWWVFDNPVRTVQQVMRSGFVFTNITLLTVSIVTTDDRKVFVGSFCDLRKLKRMMRKYLPHDTKIINKELFNSWMNQYSDIKSETSLPEHLKHFF